MHAILESVKRSALLILIAGCADIPSEPLDEPHPAEAHEEALIAPAHKPCAGPLGLTCSAGRYCSAARPGRCPSPSTFGICAPKPTFCTKEYRPVCGCDGRTYDNPCVAASAGIAVRAEGACDHSTGPFCGGIAGIVCPGLGTCIDDPSDSCDPRRGGADCGGLCTCPASLHCLPGMHWSSNPELCRCVPDACTQDPCISALCPTGTQCIARNCAPSCEPVGPICQPCTSGKICPTVCIPVPR